MAVPKLRFPEFTDDWEQRKLSDLVDVCSGMDYKHLSIGNIPVFGTGGYMLSVDKALSYDRDAIGIGRKGTIDKPYILKAPFWTVDTLFYCIPRDEGTLNFDYDLFQCIDWKQKDESTGVPSLSKVAINDTDVMVPKTDEQKKIGYFFEELDLVITLHQRKLDDIKLLKKSMLQKMFPAEGRDVPEVRFPGFTAAWEQRKLGDLYTERNERGNGSLQILSVSIHTGVSDGELDVDNLGKFVRRSEDKSTYKHVHSGDLIFNMMRAWQGAIGVAKTEGMISPAYISAIPSEDIYPPFMNYLLRRKDVINQINNLSYGVTDFRKRLYWNSFVQVNCKLPSVEEQRNITDVFEKIDHLITLHQRKCDDLQKLIKALLQQMFCLMV